MLANGALAPLVAELPLASPPLAPEWEGRRISLFAIEPGVASPGVDRPPPVALRLVMLPVSDEPAAADHHRGAAPPEPFAPSPFDAAFLLSAVPRLRDAIAPASLEPRAALASVLALERLSRGPAAWDVALMGGEPEAIQNDHALDCPTCGRGLRFLVQLGSEFDGLVPGDGPVTYVYGCDAHPERAEAVVDCF